MSVTISKSLYEHIILCLEETADRPFECDCEPYQENDYFDGTGAWIHDEDKCWMFMQDHIEATLEDIKHFLPPANNQNAGDASGWSLSRVFRVVQSWVERQKSNVCP